jgi:hypothetical protein
MRKAMISAVAFVVAPVALRGIARRDRDHERRPARDVRA